MKGEDIYVKEAVTRFSPNEIAIRSGSWMGFALYMLTYTLGWLPNEYQVQRDGYSIFGWFWHECGVCGKSVGDNLKTIRRKTSNRPSCKKCGAPWRYVRVKVRPQVLQEKIDFDFEILGNMPVEMVACDKTIHAVTKYTNQQLEAIRQIIEKSK